MLITVKRVHGHWFELQVFFRFVACSARLRWNLQIDDAVARFARASDFWRCGEAIRPAAPLPWRSGRNLQCLIAMRALEFKCCLLATLRRAWGRHLSSGAARDTGLEHRAGYSTAKGAFYMTLVWARSWLRCLNAFFYLKVSHLKFAGVVAQSTRILSRDGAHAAYTRTMLPSTATLQTGHEEHFREHSTQQSMWPQFAKIVLVGRSQHIAHCLPTFSSSLSPGSTFVTTRLCAF